MNNEEILEKAIEKAIKNGYKQIKWKDKKGTEWINYNLLLCQIGLPIPIIFSHYFAKAFWGEGEAEEQYNKTDKHWHDTSCCSGSGVFFRGERWQYHLQQMVLEEEPLKYLERFLSN